MIFEWPILTRKIIYKSTKECDVNELDKNELEESDSALNKYYFKSYVSFSISL